MEKCMSNLQRPVGSLPIGRFCINKCNKGQSEIEIIFSVHSVLSLI